MTPVAIEGDGPVRRAGLCDLTPREGQRFEGARHASRQVRRGIPALARALWIGLALLAAPATAQIALDEAPPVACRTGYAFFLTPGGGRTGFSVEIADTPAARAEGLMWRRSLAPGTGMLFIYDSPELVSFWMRNTYVPLDMIFVGADGQVQHVHANARPLDETPIPGGPEPVLMVVEVNAGVAAQSGITPGAVMAHPRLPQSEALWPCA